MIYLDLFLGFLKVGCFSFGGGYGAIPLIRDVVLSHGWLSDEAISYMIAVGESTPGPVMVNMATYVGSSQAGILGALAATLAVVLPSFTVILLVSSLLKSALKNPYVQAVLRGMKPCVVGIVLATGLYMVLQNCIAWKNVIHVDLIALVVTLILTALVIGYQRFMKKKMSPIMLIVISAIAGMVAYGV